MHIQLYMADIGGTMEKTMDFGSQTPVARWELYLMSVVISPTLR